METRKEGAGCVVARVPPSHGRQVAVTAMDVETATPAQDGETEARETVAACRAEDAPPKATPNHLGAIALVEAAVGLVADVLGILPADEGVARHTVRATPRAAVPSLGRLPTEATAREGGAPATAGLTLVDGEVEVQRAPATVGLEVHAPVRLAPCHPVLALEVRIRRPTAITKAVRAGVQGHLPAVRREGATPTDASGKAIAGDDVAAIGGGAATSRTQVVGLRLEDGGGPRSEAPRLVGPHEGRVGEPAIGIGLMAKVGLPVRVAQGAWPGEAVGHEPETAVLLPAVAAAFLGVTRRARATIPGDARRWPSPAQVGRPWLEGAPKELPGRPPVPEGVASATEVAPRVALDVVDVHALALVGPSGRRMGRP